MLEKRAGLKVKTNRSFLFKYKRRYAKYFYLSYYNSFNSSAFLKRHSFGIRYFRFLRYKNTWENTDTLFSRLFFLFNMLLPSNAVKSKKFQDFTPTRISGVEQLSNVYVLLFKNRYHLWYSLLRSYFRKIRGSPRLNTIMRMHPLVVSVSYAISYIKNKKKSYSSFRLKQHLFKCIGILFIYFSKLLAFGPGCVRNLMLFKLNNFSLLNVLVHYDKRIWLVRYKTSLLKRLSQFRATMRSKKKLQSVTIESIDEFFGVSFLGASLFNLYLLLFVAGETRFQTVRRFVHLYTFFYTTVYTLYESIFFSLYLNKFLRRFMLFGKKAVAEALFFSLSSILKLHVGLQIQTLLLGSMLALRSVLVRTSVFLSGRGYVVPTPSVLDKQLKVSIKMLVVSLQKRGYLHDVIKRTLLHGKFIGRRVPVYKKVTKFCFILMRVQNFFVNLYNSPTVRLLKVDTFSNLKKNLYMFLLQRTYMQYRWR